MGMGGVEGRGWVGVVCRGLLVRSLLSGNAVYPPGSSDIVLEIREGRGTLVASLLVITFGRRAGFACWEFARIPGNLR